MGPLVNGDVATQHQQDNNRAWIHPTIEVSASGRPAEWHGLVGATVIGQSARVGLRSRWQQCSTGIDMTATSDSSDLVAWDGGSPC